MSTRFRIPLLLIVGAGMLAGCDVVDLQVRLSLLRVIVLSEAPVLCPPPVIKREETELPGFGTMVQFTSYPHGMTFASLNNRGEVALTTRLPIFMGSACNTGVIVSDTVEILARFNTDTIVTDLNDSGLAVGSYEQAGIEFHLNAAAWRDGVFIPLDGRAGERTEAFAVNNNDVIVGIVCKGQALSEVENFELVQWEADGAGWAMKRLGVPLAKPSAVNDQGQIVGVIEERLSSDPSVTRRRPFSWQDGSLTMLPTLGGDGTDYSVGVSGLNNSGWIVGTLDLPLEEGAPQDERLLIRAVLWKDGQVIILETLGGNESFANAVNDRGQIIGSSGTAEGDWHACVWEDGAPRDLNDLLPPTLGIALAGGRAMNDEGVIFANTSDTRSDRNLVMLIPSSPE